MSRVVFAREGWITFGNPNHYSGDALLLRELRARARDTDPDAKYAEESLKELESWFLSENGQKLTERNADAFGCGISDQVADYLSDMAPDGYVFELRKNRGNYNYGYFRCALPGFFGSNEGEAGWITPEEFRSRVLEAYGDPGVHAAESMCLTQEDYDEGYDHCVERILPALEEELIADGGLP